VLWRRTHQHRSESDGFRWGTGSRTGKAAGLELGNGGATPAAGAEMGYARARADDRAFSFATLLIHPLVSPDAVVVLFLRLRHR
jgi:hypothetical protein